MLYTLFFIITHTKCSYNSEQFLSYKQTALTYYYFVRLVFTDNALCPSSCLGYLWYQHSNSNATAI